MSHEKAEQIIKQIDEAQHYLASLFSLAPELKLRAIESSKLGQGIESTLKDLPSHVFYFNSHPSNFEVAHAIGYQLYTYANPTIHDEIFRQINRLIERKSVHSPLPDYNDNEYWTREGYQRLIGIVTGCCGLAFSIAKENIEEHPITFSEKRLEKIWEAISESSPTPTNTAKAYAENDVYLSYITTELFSKRGYHIIEDLAQLSFKEAQDCIRAHTRFDIATPWEKYEKKF